MDFTRLNAQDAFLQLRTKESGLVLAHIDGRGPEPHGVFSSTKEIPLMVMLPDTTRIKILDATGREYSEGIGPTYFNLSKIRKALSNQTLVFYDTYQDYTKIQKDFGVEPLPIPR